MVHVEWMGKGSQPWNQYANVALIRCFEGPICLSRHLFFSNLTFLESQGIILAVSCIYAPQWYPKSATWFLTRKQIGEPKAKKMGLSIGLLINSYNVLFLWNKGRKAILLGAPCPQTIWSLCQLLLISSLHRFPMGSDAESQGGRTGAGGHYWAVLAYLKEKCIICVSVGDRWDLTVIVLCALHVFHKS